MFKNISEAYAVLSNPERKRKYDKWGQTTEDNYDDGMEDFMGMFGMGDLFGDQGFGGGSFDDDAEFDVFMSFLEKDNVGSF